MTKKRIQTPDYRIVLVRRDPLKYVRRGSSLFLRLLLVGLAAGILVYNQYALIRVNEAVHDLKESLLLKEAEFPIKRMLDKRAGKTLSELERIRVTQLIASKGEHGIDPYFTLDLIRRESSFDPKAVSHKGALGLMQLLPSTAKWLAEKEGLPWQGKEMLFDPVTNVQFGLAYLKYLSGDFHGESLLRVAYQAGPNQVKKTMGEGGYYAGTP